MGILKPVLLEVTVQRATHRQAGYAIHYLLLARPIAELDNVAPSSNVLPFHRDENVDIPDSKPRFHLSDSVVSMAGTMVRRAEPFLAT